MHRLEFEPTIPVFGRAKTIHALNRSATVIGDLVEVIFIKFELAFSGFMFGFK
jgi:hypothetical protein